MIGVLSTINSIYFVPVFVTVLYVIIESILKRKKVVYNLFLYFITIVPLFISSSIYLSMILSLLSLYNAIKFSRNKITITTLKYYFLAYAFMMLANPLFDVYRASIIIILLIFMFVFVSQEKELNDSNIFLSNITVLSIIISKMLDTNSLLSISLPTVIIIAILISLLRFIFDKNLSNIIYFFPLIIVGSLFGNKLYTLFFYVYSLIIALKTVKKHKNIDLILLIMCCIPFIDSTLFYNSITNVLNISGIDHSFKYMSLIIVFLFILAAFKFCEQIKKINYQKLSIVSVFLVMVSLAIVFYPVYVLKMFDLNKTFPVLVAIPLIVLDAFYIKLLFKIKQEIVLDKIILSLISIYNFIISWLDKITFFSARFFQKASIYLLKYIYFVLKFLRYYFLLIIVRTIKIFKRGLKILSLLFVFIEKTISRHNNIEAIIAIAAIITIILFNILGD